MKIFDTTVKTFVAAFISIFEKKFQKTTEIQINNIIETNRFVVKTKIILIIFKKISTASAVEISSFDYLWISSTNAIEAANILQTNQNLNSNFIEISNTTLNSKNFKLISYSLLISFANAIEAANILQTNQNLNLNFIEISNTSLNFNFILNFNFDLTSSPQSRTFTKKIQHREKITKRFQQQKKIQSESESTVNTSAIKSFESENMTLYSIFDFFEKKITNTIEIKHS